MNLEDLKIKNMSKSTKGTLGNKGKNVKAKSGINREILCQGWGGVQLKYKLEWSGRYLELVPAKAQDAQSACTMTKKIERAKSLSALTAVLRKMQIKMQV